MKRAKAVIAVRAVTRVELHEDTARYTLSCGHVLREPITRGLPQIPGLKRCTPGAARPVGVRDHAN